MKWAPLLEGGLAARALEELDRIRAVLVAGRPDPERPSGRFFSPSVGFGDAGRAVFLDYAARSGLGRAAERAAAGAYLSRALETLGERALPAAFYFGSAGVGWTLLEAHGATAGAFDAADDAADALATFDDAVLDWAEREVRLEVFGGLAGALLYATSRAAAGLGRRIAEVAAGRLAAGLAAAPGLPVVAAHGLAGIAGAAAAAVRGFRDLASARAVSAAASRAMERAPRDEAGVWATPSPATEGWCNGNAGVGAVLLAAGRERQGVALLRREAARRDRCPAADPRMPPVLCCGASGYAHLFNAAFQRTGLDDVREAALAWYERILESGRARPGTRLDGEDGVRLFGGGSHESGLLLGIAGVGAVLAAGLSDRPPTWDRILLLR